MVLLAAILLVFTVLVIEFRSFNEPVAIVFGAILAMFGTVAALWITGVTLNIVSFLGAIIGVGIVAKNGILMLDCAATGVCRHGIGGGAGAFRPPAFASSADDVGGGCAGHVAARGGRRFGRGHAASAGHCRHRRAVHLQMKKVV